MQLYNAVKLQKTGKDMRDLELVHAAEQLEIVWVDEVTIRFQLRAKSDMMVGLQEVLGMKLGEFVEPDALESSQKILEELEKMGLAASPAPAQTPPEPQPQKLPELQQGHKPNPFFDRSKDE